MWSDKTGTCATFYMLLALLMALMSIFTRG